MNLSQHIQEVVNRLQHDYPNAKCSINLWGDPDTGCWVDFELPNYPMIVVQIESRNGAYLYDAHSIWHGTEYDGSRFGTPKQYPSIDSMLIRLNQMVQEYTDTVARVQASKQVLQ